MAKTPTILPGENCSCKKMAESSKVTTGYKAINITDEPVFLLLLRAEYIMILAVIERKAAIKLSAILIAFHLRFPRPPSTLMANGMKIRKAAPIIICIRTGDILSADNFCIKVVMPQIKAQNTKSTLGLTSHLQYI